MGEMKTIAVYMLHNFIFENEILFLPIKKKWTSESNSKILSYSVITPDYTYF